MDSTYFSSPEFQFWLTELTNICIRERLACRPFSRTFSTMAYARMEMADNDQHIKLACKDAGVELVKSFGGKSMIRAEDFYRAFCSKEE